MLRQRDGKHCNHYLHARCVRVRPPKGACAVCGVGFERIERFPDISEPRAWFDAIDVNRDGRLSRTEVVEAFKATVVNLDVERFQRDIDSLWANWDVDRDGFVSYEEIFRESYGLLAFAREQYSGSRTMTAAPPALTDPYNWFTFWDADRSETLDKAEVHRALVKTFDLEGDPAKTETMGSTLDAVWGIFDHDNNGTIDRAEFAAPDGLGATLAANLAHVKRRTYPAPLQHPHPTYAHQPTAPHQPYAQQPTAAHQPYAVVASPVSGGDSSSYGDAALAQAVVADAAATTSEADMPPGYLPPNWEERLTPEGRLYYANNATRQTQWDRPVA